MNRIKQLDSLRGLAALFVMFSHFSILFPIMLSNTRNQGGLGLINVVKYSPLHFYWAGHEAVMFFFVLSGFVLSLPFYSQAVGYGSFVVKRICRIYIPYLVAVAFGVVMRLLFANMKAVGASSWLYSNWNNKVTLGNAINHILLVTEFNYHSFDPVIWSLVHEMRISLIFPLLMYFVKRVRLSMSFLACLILSGMSIVINHFLRDGSAIDIALTLHYCAFFIIGALMAKHHSRLNAFFVKWTGWKTPIVVVLGLVFYTARWTFPIVAINQQLSDYVTVAGVFLLIQISIASKPTTRFLTWGPVGFLGKISYSFYLYHLMIFLSAVHVLSSFMPVWIIFLVTFVVTLAASTLSYYYVELPSINMARKWAKKFDRVNVKPSVVINS